MVLGKPLDDVTRVPGEYFVAQSEQSSNQPVASAESNGALKLMILTQFFPPDFAATGQLIEELAKQLGQQGVDVTVFTGQPGYAFATEDAPSVEQKGGVKVKRSRMSQLVQGRIRGKAFNGLLFAVRAILHLMRRSRQYDVLLVTTAPPFLPVICYIANLFFGSRYVCLLYDLYPDIAVELEVVKQNHPVAKLWRVMNRLVWQRSSGIVALSDSMKARIAQQCPAVADRISVIHSWSDDEKIVPIAKTANWFAKEHDLTDSFVVLYSGNMGRCHDIDTLLETAVLLKDEPILFVCIGGGAKRKRLIEDAATLGLENFRFLPYQEKDVLPFSLTVGDVSLVSVAAEMESLVAPSKLYPAMATGRAIGAICPSGSYLGDLLQTVGCGAAFENGDAQGLAEFIRGLAADGDRGRRMGEAGRRYLEGHFTPKIIAGEYLTLVKAAAKQ